MMKVVQCWDDGIINDERLTDLFRKYGAKATFNLNPGLMDPEKRGTSRWVQPGEEPGWSYKGFLDAKLSLKDIPVVYKGFKVASHCWKHENAGWMPDNEWIKCAVDARKLLEDIVQESCPGFAWPCGRHTPETIDLLRENGFIYGRTTESTYNVTDCKEPLAIAANCHFQSPDFWERYRRAKETGVFYFWGHSYELMHYDDLWNEFEKTIKYITDDPDTEWAYVADIVPLLNR